MLRMVSGSWVVPEWISINANRWILPKDTKSVKHIYRRRQASSCMLVEITKIVKDSYIAEGPIRIRWLKSRKRVRVR